MEIQKLSHYLSSIPIELSVSQLVKDLILEKAAQNPEEQVKSLQDCFKNYLVQPISNLSATKQLVGRKKLIVDLLPDKKEIIFK